MFPILDTTLLDLLLIALALIILAAAIHILTSATRAFARYRAQRYYRKHNRYPQ